MRSPPLARPQPPRTNPPPRPAASNAPTTPTTMPPAREARRSLFGVTPPGPSVVAFTPAGLHARCVHPRWPDPSPREHTTGPASTLVPGHPPSNATPATAGCPETCCPGAFTPAGPTPAAANAPAAEARRLQRTNHAHDDAASLRSPAFPRRRHPAGALRWCVHPGWPRRRVRSPPLARPQPPPTHRRLPPPRARRRAPRCAHRRWPDPSPRERTSLRGQPPPTHHPRPRLRGQPAKRGVRS